MTAGTGRRLLERLAQGWRRRQYLAEAFRLSGLLIPLLAISDIGGPALGWIPWAAAVAAALVLAWLLPRKPLADARSMALHLDRVVPELEESSTLFLEDRELSPMEALQSERALDVLTTLDSRRIVGPSIWSAGARLAAAGVLTAVLVWVVIARIGSATTRNPVIQDLLNGPFQADSSLDGIDVLIEPPEYTGVSPQQQSDLEIHAEEGSRVTWRLQAADTKSVRLLTGIGESLDFRTTGDSLYLEHVADHSFVYRLIVESEGREIERSDFTRFEVIPDDAPQLLVVEPELRLTLLDGAVGSLDLEVRARDDYGLARADLVTTLALGSGEQVEFRERRTPLADPRGETDRTFRHTLDLQEMGVGPASELYFHVEAEDNREPNANFGRSSTTIVRIPGEAAASVDLSEGLPVILPPTYFRSQRQIIIDTEKLISEAPGISQAEFRDRSESLGRDQRALRMRHGALLGEEFVSGQAAGPESEEGDEHDGHGDHDEHGDHERGDHDEHGDHEHDEHPVTDGKTADILEMLPEGMVHAHDSSEISTYFTSETRTLLKRILAEMWDAEGRLRVIDPKGALPYEYRALKLLKELQQASRIYVQKVGFDAPPLEPIERRLTGDLDDVRTKYREEEPPPAPEVEAAARTLLAAMDLAGPLSSEAIRRPTRTLRPVLARLAATEPDAVRALDALDTLVTGQGLHSESESSLRAVLWRLLPEPDRAPVRQLRASDSLSDAYRELQSAGGSE